MATELLKLTVGIRFAKKDSIRIPLKGVSATKSVSDLKQEIGSMVPDVSPDNIEIIHHGRILLGDKSLGEQNIRSGSTLYVQERALTAGRVFVATEKDIQAALLSLRKMSYFIGLTKTFAPNVLRDIFDEYPEFHSHLGAMVILRNLSLWLQMKRIPLARRFAQEYPILIVSAPFVVDSFRRRTNIPEFNRMYATDEDSEIEEESDVDPTEGVAPADEPPAPAMVSALQLAEALQRAIANPGGSAGEQPPPERPVEFVPPPAIVEVGASGPASGWGPPAAAGPSPRNPISSSLFSQALLGAMGQHHQEDEPARQGEQNPVDPPVYVDPLIQYSDQLRTIAELGLADEERVIDALEMFNGNVEQAIEWLLQQPE